jgi:acetolactate synthase-1/3 small subunit
MAMTRHILFALLEDKPGVLNRMTSVFRRRGFNIHSVNVIDTINVGSSELPNLTRVTIVLDGEATVVEEVRKQLEKIIDVVKVSEITAEGAA